MRKSRKEAGTFLPDGVYSLIHQFDMIHITVKKQIVKSIRPLKLLSESTSTPNILTCGQIALQPNPKFRKKLMTMEGMEITAFLKEVEQIDYKVWRKLSDVR
jgi:hypothetical protein